MPEKAESEDPLYIQIARTLKQQIVNGEFPVGSQLPTEGELCERFSVSRYTVRGALNQLRDDGLISSRRGAGTVVIPPPSIGSRSFGAMSIEDLLHFAQGSYITIQCIKMLAIDKQLAERTGLTLGEEWLFARALGFNVGSEIPLGLAEYYINREFAGVARLLEVHKVPIFPLIEDLYGVRMMEVRQEISATLVPPEFAAQLLVQPGSPALEVRHTYKLANGTVAQLTINTHPSERYRHAVTMRRVKS